MRSRAVEGVQLKATEQSAYEFEVGAFDYHVRKEGRVWVLDQFQTGVANAGEAHLGTFECASLEDAVLYAIEA